MFTSVVPWARPWLVFVAFQSTKIKTPPHPLYYYYHTTLLMIVTTVNASSLRNMRGFNPNRPNPSADHAQSSCSLTPQSQDGTDFLDLSLIRLFLSGMQPPIDTSTLLMTMSEVAFIYLMIRTNYSSQVITTESRMAILIPTCNSISSRSRAPR